MAETTHVFYRALADFSSVKKEADKAKKSFAELKAAEAAYNASLTTNRQTAIKASQKRTDALKKETKAIQALVEAQKKISQRRAGETSTVKAVQAETTALEKATIAHRRHSDALDKNTSVTDKARTSTVRFVDSVGDVDEVTGEVTEALDKSTAATSRWGSGLSRLGAYFQRFALDTDRLSRSQDALNRARLRQEDSADRVRIAEFRLAEAIKKSGEGSAQAAAAQSRLNIVRRDAARSVDAVSAAMARLRNEGGGLPPIIRRVRSEGEGLWGQFQKFSNWRPRLVPPFVALIPIIGAVIASINPLIALLGAVGTAAFGLVANIGSLSGAFLALPGILSGVVAGITSVIASMGGVGNVFKTYSAMQKAMGRPVSGGGGGGNDAARRADQLAAAERNLARAQRTVTKAQESLNDARERALKDLIDLRIEVSRSALNEERAIASLVLAREEYNNVMADPGSTQGDKLDAAVRIKEAEADLEDVRRRNIENQKELNDAEAKGVENSDRVLDAKDRLFDALENERDAQRGLRQDVEGTAGAMSAADTAMDEYNKALAELSPSARAVVLALIALQSQWKAMRSDLQENFFSQFAGDMDKLPRIIQNIGNFLRPAAAAMGQFVSSLITMLASDEWSRDLAIIGEQNGRVLTKLGEALLSLATFFKDLIIAAAPFTDWMMNGLAEGADNFSKLLDTEAERESLRNWLEKVADRLSRWWQIIKNIGKTLFNYGAAASGFGDWLSEGFLQTTENWRAASEAAREEGSPFKKFLEDIKPVLSEVNGLIGDFFGWLSKEIMDPDNIKDAEDLVKLIREDLGPALGDLLDTLANTDIDEAFVKALTTIVESIDSIMKAGGNAALKTFFDVISGFFAGISDFLSSLPPGGADFVLSLVGGIAALALINKFSGVLTLIAGLTGLAKSAPILSRLFGKLGGLKAAGAVGGAIVAGSALMGDQEGLAPGSSAIGGAITGGSLFGPIGAAIGAVSGLLASAIKDLFDENHGAWNAGWDQMFKPGDYSGAGVGEFKRWVTEELNTGWGKGVINQLFADINEGWGDGPFNHLWDDVAAGWGDGPLNSFFNDISADWSYLWGTLVPEAWTGFTTWLSGVWNGFWGGLGTWFNTTFVTPVKDGWQAIQDGLIYGWNWINTYVILPMRIGWALLGQWFNTTFVAPIQNAWKTLQDALKYGWDWINTYVFQPFQRGLSTLRSWFDTGIDGLKMAWDRLRGIFAEPVRFVVDTVYNGGILPFWNGINDALKLNMRLNPVRLGFKEGGVLPGYSPGVDNHHFVDQHGNRLDLGGGEGILRPEATRQLGGKRGIEDINNRAKRGQAFANGGVFASEKKSMGRRKPGTGGPWEDIVNFAGDVFGKIPKFFSDPIGFITNGIGSVIDPLLRRMPAAGNFSEIIKTMPHKVVGGLANFAKVKADQGNKQQEQSLSGGGPAPANVMGWQSQWNAVKGAFPGARLNSAFRPGDPLYHGKGRAIDVTASMDIFNWIRQNYGNSRELIYSPAGSRQLQNGQNYLWHEPVRSQHFDHVHWAMKNGGVFDKGGMLQPGQAGFNFSRKPEAVLTDEESRGLRALISATGLANNRGLSPINPGVNMMNSVPKIVDNSVNIENLHVHNPVPEPMAESLPKTIRRVGYMNSARGT